MVNESMVSMMCSRIDTIAQHLIHSNLFSLILLLLLRKGLGSNLWLMFVRVV